MGVLEVYNLTKIFKGKKGTKVVALNDVSLTVQSGEVFGFLGPNGAGKSTTIKTLLGLIRPTAGKVFIHGMDSLLSDARRRIGYLPENPAFYDYMTAEEYLYFVGGIFGVSDSILTSRCEMILKRLDLWDARKRPMRGYSKGMVQRVGLAQVLVHDPDVFILDEPMSGLDPLGRALVKEIILELRAQGKTVFFSTHITSDVESVCDRVGIICNGTLKSVERVDRIMEEGITGYTITATTSEGQTRVVTVSRDELTKVLAEMTSSRCFVSLIEPVRKNLERFFLDIIHESRKP